MYRRWNLDILRLMMTQGKINYCRYYLYKVERSSFFQSHHSSIKKIYLHNSINFNDFKIIEQNILCMFINNYIVRIYCTRCLLNQLNTADIRKTIISLLIKASQQYNKKFLKLSKWSFNENILFKYCVYYIFCFFNLVH